MELRDLPQPRTCTLQESCVERLRIRLQGPKSMVATSGSSQRFSSAHRPRSWQRKFPNFHADGRDALSHVDLRLTVGCWFEVTMLTPANFE
jgi:hypothetical protein